MRLKAKISCTRQFEIDGKRYVQIQGFLENKGLFSQTVSEKLVPDKLEGKSIELDYDIGLDNRFRPYLKTNSIVVINNDK